MIYRVYTDGGARGNPGPAAVGGVIKDGQGNRLHSFGQKIGIATNNVAEYRAVIAALEWLSRQSAAGRPPTVTFFLDSTLVVHQLRGEWKIKQPHLLPLAESARQLIGALGCPVIFLAVPREQNREADALVNQALDSAKIG